MSDYLHGVEVIENDSFNMTISDADISSVVVVGTSLKNVEEYCKITNFTESVNYVGKNIDGLTLADAVETVLTESGGADIYPINIFDKTKHYASVEKTITFTNGECVLTEIGINDLVLAKNSTPLVVNEDYTFEDSVIKILSGGELETDQTGVTASYKYADLSKITDSDVIGGVDENGKRTGLQKIYDIIATFGIIPGIIIVPNFTSKNIRTAVETVCENIGAFFYADLPKGTSLQKAEKARLKALDGLDLTTVSENTMIAMPYVYRYNSNSDTTTLKPYSPVLAGIRVKLDRERNVAKSIDNTELKTVTGTEFPIYFKLNDKNCDANRFNKLGIATVINYKGAYHSWGGRNASYPSKEGLMTFESAKRTRLMVQKSIENASFVCVGETVTRGFIDDVLNTINAQFAKWSNTSDSKNCIMYQGEAYWDESLNTAESLADGKIRFPFKWCPLCVAEHIVFEDILEISFITKALNNN